MVFILLKYSKKFSLKHSHFTINEEGPNNGSTCPYYAVPAGVCVVLSEAFSCLSFAAVIISEQLEFTK